VAPRSDEERVSENDMRWTGIVVASALAAACGGGATGSVKTPGDAAQTGPKTASGEVVAEQAAAGFEEALAAFIKHDKASEWSDSTCKTVAGQFKAAAEEQQDEVDRAFPEALYNAGLVYQRCGDEAQARAHFQAASAAGKGGFHDGDAQETLYKYAKTKDLNSAITRLEEIIRAAKFQNVAALVNLAALQMERAGQSDAGAAKADYAAAKLNIQRAMALDDSYMPAFNQLSVYYLELARAKANEGQGKRKRGRMVVSGRTKKGLNKQQLELSLLVADQAIARNPNYAPIYNTVGLIQVEQRKFNNAVRSFGKARKLDPKFYEAHMNYGAVNLLFRGFGEAEKAYRAALKMNPDEYEAHLGLALAMRGQINEANFDEYTKATEKHLADAKKLAPNRAETYYNEAIFAHEYKAKYGTSEEQIVELGKVKIMYRTFIGKAGPDPAFIAAVTRSKERIQDIEDIVTFLEGSIEAQKAQAAIDAAQKAKAAAAAAAPPPAPAEAAPASAGTPADTAAPAADPAPAPAPAAPTP
jgi:tetratricopeptide (TPR) repeat protein